LECVLDRLDDAIEIIADIRVPESEGTKSRSPQDRVAHRVMINLTLVVRVLATIDLHDQPALEAYEVEIKAEQRRLTTKMEAIDTHLSKLLPEARLLRGQGFSQLTGAFRRGSRLPHPGRFAACPSP
jgi:hypothetical protein